METRIQGRPRHVCSTKPKKETPTGDRICTRIERVTSLEWREKRQCYTEQLTFDNARPGALQYFDGIRKHACQTNMGEVLRVKSAKFRLQSIIRLQVDSSAIAIT